jgi:hypothetical protein
MATEITVVEPVSFPVPVVRTRARPVPVAKTDEATPAVWSNGSAVMREGFVSPVPTWGTTYEGSGGLLGRYERQANGSYKVWRWSQTQRGYIYLGVTPNHLAALAMLG